MNYLIPLSSNCIYTHGFAIFIVDFMENMKEKANNFDRLFTIFLNSFLHYDYFLSKSE